MRYLIALLAIAWSQLGNASLEDDGVWNAGVWATTVWAEGVWFEGESAASGHKRRRIGFGFGVGQ